MRRSLCGRSAPSGCFARTGVPPWTGNHRSAELCRKLLGQQAQVYGLAKEVSLAGSTPTGAVEVEPVEPDMDELAKLRAARARAYG